MLSVRLFTNGSCCARSNSSDGSKLQSHVRPHRWPRPNGKLIDIGLTSDPIEVTPLQLISGSLTIQGWSAGTPADSEDTLRFAELSGVRPMIETYPLEKAAEAYARMISGKARFRVVLTM
jgi:D-arabinose 1-dehydrogenase-like Zn-dependent alcohol dehydrogenase